jgi:hypothetical protein
VFERAYPSTSLSQFRRIVHERLRQAAHQTGRDDVVVPVGLLLLIDHANGGDATADELARRFHLLDNESCDIIDFHFAGWRRAGKSIEFSLEAFSQFHTALRNAGVQRFGGNADLILVDASWNGGEVALAFDEAIHVDLADAVRRQRFPALGAFLQTLIDTASSVRADVGSADSPVDAISDRLGVTLGGRSALAYFLEKWGAIIGAGALATLAVKRVGRRVPLRSF